MSDWRARFGAVFERLRIPLALVCITGGLVAVAVPVWSGWWTQHIQAVKGREFSATLAARTSSTPAGGTAPTIPTVARSGASSGQPSVTGAVYGSGGSSTHKVAPTLNVPHAAPTGAVLASLQIPAIGVDAFVVDGLTLNPSVWGPLLREGPAHLAGSALPGQPGNMVIFGHVNIWGSVFLNLHKLKPGDQIIVTASWGRYVYQVTGSQEIVPTDTAAVAPQNGPPTLQLITCTGILDAHRLVVAAKLVSGASAQSSTGSATQAGGGALPTTGAVGLVNRYVQLLAAGHASAGWALWAPAWQATHPEAAWAAVPPLPAGAQLSDVSIARYPNGETYVSGRVTAPGPYGPEWSPAGFVVGSAGGSLRLMAGGLSGPTPLTNLQAQAVHLSPTKQQGHAACGPYTVQWTAERGPTPGQWTQLSITGPAGKVLPPLPLPPLTFSTYPTWCGDMLGNGSTELILTAAFTGAATGEQQASVFELQPDGFQLLGQVTAWANPAYPKPEAVNGMYPYEVMSSMVLDVIGSHQEVITHPVWADTGLDFQPETQAFPQYLQQQLTAQLAAIAHAPACTSSGPPPCAGSDYVLAYYFAWDLRQGPSVLAKLDALLPPAERSWMAAQASMVREAIGAP